ncbi:hypothetical protein TNCV_21111 [Trichonephila clavipes]|nr:hypothetical protein TNCV_21111 [Trichonephila clavipes]
MLLSKIAVDQYTWTNILRRFKNSQRSAVCATYRQACQELNLLENDAHWDTARADASNTARPQQIRTLFAITLKQAASHLIQKIFGKIQGLHE